LLSLPVVDNWPQHTGVTVLGETVTGALDRVVKPEDNERCKSRAGSAPRISPVP
jgi:hypothetical protein